MARYCVIGQFNASSVMKKKELGGMMVGSRFVRGHAPDPPVLLWYLVDKNFDSLSGNPYFLKDIRDPHDNLPRGLRREAFPHIHMYDGHIRGIVLPLNLVFLR